MKILCMLETNAPASNELVLEFAKKTFPNEMIVTGYWCKPDDDVAKKVRQIEVQGPDNAEIPEAFYMHKDAEILVGTFCPFSKAGLSVFNNLKVLGVVRAGMENVDVKGAEELGIMVVNATGRNADSVSDFAIAMMMAENRKIAKSHHTIMQGGFREKFSNSQSMMDMRNKTVGLIGFGYIGTLVAEKLSGFHMTIFVYDPYVDPEKWKDSNVMFVDKETVCKESDFISIHARLTDASRHIIGAKEIALMKDTAILVNTARAGLVDYDALADALIHHRIGGAALDVFENEPLEKDSPLYSLDNVTLTAHIAGFTNDAKVNSGRLIFERIANVLKGEETPICTPGVLKDKAFQEWRRNVNK